jgi:glycosyltransferase involved in cell wall biosynthesis
LLLNNNIPFRCVYVGGEGDVSSKQLEEKICQYGLQAFVQYQGKKYDKEKEQDFSESDIFVLPTYCECFPLVNIEAMQYSLPVISTREGGIPDIVVDGVNGFLIPVQNALALAEKLEILIENLALRNTMGLAGRRMYVKKFTLKIFENRMVEILQDCLNKKVA